MCWKKSAWLFRRVNENIPVPPSSPAFTGIPGSQAQSLFSYCPPISNGCRNLYPPTTKMLPKRYFTTIIYIILLLIYYYILTLIFKSCSQINSETVCAENVPAVTHHQCRAAGMCRAIQPGCSASNNLQIKEIYFVPGMILLKVLFDLIFREAFNSIYASARHRSSTNYFESTLRTLVNFICMCLHLGIISVHSKNCNLPVKGSQI